MIMNDYKKNGKKLVSLAFRLAEQAREEALSDMAKQLGKKGGSVKSEAKTKAVRENGKKGGRPKLSK